MFNPNRARNNAAFPVVLTLAAGLAVSACTAKPATISVEVAPLSVEAQAQRDGNNLKAKIEVLLGRGEYECEGDKQEIIQQFDRTSGTMDFIVQTEHGDPKHGETDYYFTAFSVLTSDMAHGTDTTSLNAHDASVAHSSAPLGQYPGGGDYSYSLYNLENEWRVVAGKPTGRYGSDGVEFFGSQPTGIEQELTRQVLSATYAEADSVLSEALAVNPGCDAPDHKKQV